MPSERLAPSAIAEQTALSGAVSSIQDDPDSPDGNWLTSSAGNDTALRVTFPAPSGSPAGTQEFRALVRKTGQPTAPTGRIELYDNGALVRSGADSTVSAQTVLSFTWNASEISGSAECRVVGTTGGGKPADRAALEVGAIEWNAETAAPTINLTADDTEAASEVTGPAFGQAHVLSAGGVEAASEASTPTLGQVHGLGAVSVEGASEVGSPALGEAAGEDALLAVDVESVAEVSGASLGQVHGLLAQGTESATQISGQALGQAHVLMSLGVQAASGVSAPVTGQTHGLAPLPLVALSQVGSPALNGAVVHNGRVSCAVCMSVSAPAAMGTAEGLSGGTF